MFRSKILKRPRKSSVSDSEQIRSPTSKYEFILEKALINGDSTKFVSPSDAGNIFTGLLRRGIVVDSYIPFGLNARQNHNRVSVSSGANDIYSLADTLEKISHIFRLLATTKSSEGAMIANDAIGWSIIRRSDQWVYLLDLVREVRSLIISSFSEDHYIYYPDRIITTNNLEPKGLCTTKLVDLDIVSILSFFVKSVAKYPEKICGNVHRASPDVVIEQLLFLSYFVWTCNYSSVKNFHSRVSMLYESYSVLSTPLSISNASQYFPQAIIGYVFPHISNDVDVNNVVECIIPSYPTDYLPLEKNKFKCVLHSPTSPCEIQALELLFLSKYSTSHFNALFGSSLLSQTLSFITNAFIGWHVHHNNISVEPLMILEKPRVEDKVNLFGPILKKLRGVSISTPSISSNDLFMKNETVKLDLTGESHLYDMTFIQSLY